MSKELNIEEGINLNDLELLESDEFNSLIEAAELMAMAQGNILQLSKTIQDLREIVEADKKGHVDNLPEFDNSKMHEIVESMQELLEGINLLQYHRDVHVK